MGYTVRQILGPHSVTRSTKLRGAQRSSELTLRSMEFRSLENLIFPALVNFNFIYIYIYIYIYISFYYRFTINEPATTSSKVKNQNIK